MDLKERILFTNLDSFRYEVAYLIFSLMAMNGHTESSFLATMSNPFDCLTQVLNCLKKTFSKLVIIPHVNKKFDQEEKLSILEIISNNAVIFLADHSVLLDSLQTCFEKAEDVASKLKYLDDDEKNDFIRDRAFIQPARVVELMHTFPIINFHSKTEKGGNVINFNIKPQPSFNKNFKLLIEALEENQKNGLENYLFTDNPRQIDRF